MDTDLLEHLAAHQAHASAAKIFGAVAAFPFRQVKFARITPVQGRFGREFDGFEAAADVFLKGAEPVPRAHFLGIKVGDRHGLCLAA